MKENLCWNALNEVVQTGMLMSFAENTKLGEIGITSEDRIRIQDDLNGFKD